RQFLLEPRLDLGVVVRAFLLGLVHCANLRKFPPAIACSARVPYPIKNRLAEEHREKALADSPAPSAASVTVTAPARLHLVFLDPSGGLGRRFASVGLAISELRTRIHIRSAASSQVEGAERARVAQHIETMRRHLHVEGPYAARVEQTVPAHAGLG